MRYGRGIVRGQLEVGVGLPGALDEQPHRLRSGRCAPVQARAAVGQGEPWDAPDHFAREAERLATGDEQAQAWTRAEELVGEWRAAIEQVLAIVQDEQQPR